jgi:hypothetical protein
MLITIFLFLCCNINYLHYICSAKCTIHEQMNIITPQNTAFFQSPIRLLTHSFTDTYPYNRVSLSSGLCL